MTEERKKTLAIGRKLGAVVGGIIFLAFGIVPGFYFGSYATVILLSHLTGGPIEPSIIMRMAVVVGTILGLFCVASASIVVGAVLGTALAYVVDVVSVAVSPRAKEIEERA
ncbi:MAG: hypothetical protein D6778_08340 [Nitrospirae bacterium]|nr:MAG: hypothetical protein D6778_08340 [Nitrospirota bacterium]